MSIDETELRLAWQRAAGTSRMATRLFDSVLERHREPHRRYHGVRHVVWVVRHVHALARREPVDDLGAVVAAAFFHDAVYQPAASDNEAASARLARRALVELDEAAWPPARAERVADMIRATAGHLVPPTDITAAADGDLVRDVDTDVLLDADLAVLGAEPAGYQAYAAGVRAEYAHVDAPGWAAGRRSVLQQLLDRPAIFATSTAHDWWEARARANLTAELADLAGRAAR